MSSVTIQEKVENAKKAQDKLTTLKAEKKSKEKCMGVSGEATITDVQTEDLDEDIFIRFVVDLPNEEIGFVDFTEKMVKCDKIDIFLNNIDSTINDVTDALYSKIPVVYTEYHGWKTFYSKNESELKVYNSNSYWRKIGTDTGSKRANKKLTTLYHVLPFIACISFTFYSMGFSLTNLYVGLIFGFFSWVITWYLDAMWMGLSSPNRITIKLKNTE